MNNFIVLTDLQIGILLGGFILFDILMTNYTARYLKKKKPELSYEKFELNPFLIWGWKKFGINLGSIIIGLFQILLLAFLYTLMPRDVLVAFIGCFMIITIIHITNFKFSISALKDGRKVTNG